MGYFKILSLVFGGAMVFGGLWLTLNLEGWKKRVVYLYPEKRPRWVPLSRWAVLALSLATWYELSIHPSAYAFVVTFMVTLSLAKVLLLSFFYAKSREIVFGLFSEPLAFRIVMLGTVAIGAALFLLGILS